MILSPPNFLSYQFKISTILQSQIDLTHLEAWVDKIQRSGQNCPSEPGPRIVVCVHCNGLRERSVNREYFTLRYSLRTRAR